jgi:hypothetical protein
MEDVTTLKTLSLLYILKADDTGVINALKLVLFRVDIWQTL